MQSEPKKGLDSKPEREEKALFLCFFYLFLSCMEGDIRTLKKYTAMSTSNVELYGSDLLSTKVGLCVRLCAAPFLVESEELEILGY